MRALAKIESIAGSLHLESSLLLLNQILSVARRITLDAALESLISSLKCRPQPFQIHFLAKQLLLHGSNLGHRGLDWQTFVELLNLHLSLEDPIVNDPTWKNADPTGCFERILAQQATSQRLVPLQKFGLALGLFRDVGAIEYPVKFDLRRELESRLGIPLDQFMALGFVCSGLAKASIRSQACPGTFTSMYLAEAFRLGFKECVPEVWSKLLSRVACDREHFRKLLSNHPYNCDAEPFVQFGFNPLCRFPIIEAKPDHFVAVDPFLIYERITLGLFFDLFDADGVNFSTLFGHSFDRFVGQLLNSIVPSSNRWSAADWENRSAQTGKLKQTGKIGDWVVVAGDRNVLIECKSLRPSLELTTFGAEATVEKCTSRIVDAIEQLASFWADIQAGHWECEGLQPRPSIFLVATYGRINTVNGPFTRKRIRDRFAERGLDLPPFVVLSIEEIDSVIRLVELGSTLDDVLVTLAGEDSFDVLARYRTSLNADRVSSLTRKRATAFLDAIGPGVTNE